MISSKNSDLLSILYHVPQDFIDSMMSNKNSDLLSILYHVSLDFIDDTIHSSWSHDNYWTDEKFPVKTWMLSVSYVIWPWTVVALGSQLISIRTWGSENPWYSCSREVIIGPGTSSLEKRHRDAHDSFSWPLLILPYWPWQGRWVKEPLFNLPKMNTLAPSLVFSDVFLWQCLSVSLKPSSGINSGITSALETQADVECAFLCVFMGCSTLVVA